MYTRVYHIVYNVYKVIQFASNPAIAGSYKKVGGWSGRQRVNHPSVMTHY